MGRLNLSINILSPGLLLLVAACSGQPNGQISSASPSSMPQQGELAFTGKDLNKHTNQTGAQTPNTGSTMGPLETQRRDAVANDQARTPEWVRLYKKLVQDKNPLLDQMDREMWESLGATKFDEQGKPILPGGENAVAKSEPQSPGEIPNIKKPGKLNPVVLRDLQELVMATPGYKLTPDKLVQFEIAGRTYTNVPLRPAEKFFKEYQQYLLLSDGDLVYREKLAKEFSFAAGYWLGQTTRSQRDAYYQPKVAIHQLDHVNRVGFHNGPKNFFGEDLGYDRKDINRSPDNDQAILQQWTRRDDNDSLNSKPYLFWTNGEKNAQPGYKARPPEPVPGSTPGNGAVLVDLTPADATSMGELLKTLVDRMGYRPTAIVEHEGKLLVVFEAQLADVVGGGSFKAGDRKP